MGHRVRGSEGRIPMLASACLLVLLSATRALGGTPAHMSGQYTGGAAGGVDHAFVLYCDPDLGQNRLELVWDSGASRFELSRVTDGFCEDDATIAGPADANFDTHRGEGEGAHDGIPGARAEWRVTASADGQQQVAWLVSDAIGTVLLDTSASISADHYATGTAQLPVVPGVDPVNVVHHAEGAARARESSPGHLEAPHRGPGLRPPQPGADRLCLGAPARL